MSQQLRTASSELSSDRVRRRTRWLVRAALCLLVGWVLYRGYWGFQIRRFGVVKPGVLYRSGQPTAQGLHCPIRRYGIRTVVSLRGRSRRALREGLHDWGQPEGPAEDQFVKNLQVQYLHWPMGQEPYWPWLPPNHLEQFYRLLDNPNRLPVLVHCVAGRHRTGTFVALFRLEYDRWPVQQALLEMQQFGFGHPVLLQEHNLRTYWPRPVLEQEDWEQLKQDWASVLPARAGESFVHWCWRLGQAGKDSRVQEHFRRWLRRRPELALVVALRIADYLPQELQAAVSFVAAGELEQSENPFFVWATAASLVADYGSPKQQAQLLAWLRSQVAKAGPVGGKYQAVAWGVLGRYRANRTPFWHALLEDRRRWPQPECCQYRICDTAAARIFCTLGQHFRGPVISWERLGQRVKAWLQHHPEALRLRRWSQGNHLVARTGRQNR